MISQSNNLTIAANVFSSVVKNIWIFEHEAICLQLQLKFLNEKVATEADLRVRIAPHVPLIVRSLIALYHSTWQQYPAILESNYGNI